MTGLWILSDLHVDSASFELPPTPPRADVLVIAGDIGDGHHKAVRWLQQHTVPTGLPVVFVAGNHDFFAGDLTDHCDSYYAAIGVELLWPSRPAVDIAGVRFVGLTLWTDYAVAGDVSSAMWWAKLNMPDLFNIDVGMRRLRPADLLSAHQIQLAVLEIVWEEPFDGPTVVVTHHAPHPGSLTANLFPASNGSYASDVTAVIERYQPALWIHGHVHQNCDYVVGGTRIVCNPRGYATPRSDGQRSGNAEFLTDLVIGV